jgi:hypothetical protein
MATCTDLRWSIFNYRQRTVKSAITNKMRILLFCIHTVCSLLIEFSFLEMFSKVVKILLLPISIVVLFNIKSMIIYFITSSGKHCRNNHFVHFCAYHHESCEFESCSWRGVLDTTLCDKVCHWLVTGRWFSPGTPVSSTNKNTKSALKS